MSRLPDSTDLLQTEPPCAPYFDEVRQAWVVSLHADVDAGLRDARLAAGTAGPWHDQYRAAARDAFSGRKLGAWEAALQDEAETLCRALKQHGTFDLLQEFARPFSDFAAVLITLESSVASRRNARSVFLAAADPFDPSLAEQAKRATLELAANFTGELAPLYVQAFVALSESLPAFLGNSCYALLNHGGDPLNATAIEELLRYAGPSTAQLRIALAPLTIGRAHIDTGCRIILKLAAANRDPAVFPSPDRLDLTRSPNPHLAFGAGAHACLGAALIRMVATVALRALFDSEPSLTMHSAQACSGFALRAIESLQASLSSLPHPGPH